MEQCILKSLLNGDFLGICHQLEDIIRTILNPIELFYSVKFLCIMVWIEKFKRLWDAYELHEFLALYETNVWNISLKYFQYRVDFLGGILDLLPTGHPWTLCDGRGSTLASPANVNCNKHTRSYINAYWSEIGQFLIMSKNISVDYRSVKFNRIVMFCKKIGQYCILKGKIRMEWYI